MCISVYMSVCVCILSYAYTCILESRIYLFVLLSVHVCTIALFGFADIQKNMYNMLLPLNL